MSQLERVAYLDRRLRERGWVTAAEVADHFEVSPRQIKRDIEYLRWRLDAPVVYDGVRHQYRYDKPFSGLKFTDERRVLFAALVQGWAASPLYRDLVWPEVLDQLRAQVAQDYRPVADRIRWEAPAAEAVDLEVFSGLCRGLRDARIVELDYRNLAGTASVRRVEVQRLLHYAGVWYLIAFDHRSGELRTFHLGRIEALRSTAEPALRAQAPGWEAEVERWINASSGIVKGGEAFEAVVRLRDDALRLARPQRWHDAQRDVPGRDDEGDYLDRALPVAGQTEWVRRLLGLGAGAEARAPEGFRAAWQQEIGRLAARAGVNI